MSRVCTVCGRDLPLEDFGAHARQREGRESMCKACKADRQRAYRATPRGAELARAAARRSKARTRARSGVSRGVVSPA